MKKLLFTLFIPLISYYGNAQVILDEDFSSATTDWLTPNGSSIGEYENFYNSCTVEYGIITPGVGGNNPAKVLSPPITPNKTLLEVQFNIDRYDANLTCNSHSDFGCPTSVDILAVESTYTGTDPIGDGAIVYSDNSGYLLPISGGTVSLIIEMPISLPDFRMFFNFSTDNCNQGGTKYVMDKFSFKGLEPCEVINTCSPVANNDYFHSGIQGFANSTLLANVYGTNLAYTPPPAHATYVKRSINNLGISQDGGKDVDIDNHPLSAMTFTLLNQTFAPADATLIFYTDGTFSFVRLNPSINQFFFTYRITDPQGNFDDATVRIDYAVGGPLPVKLTDFTAVKRNAEGHLSWKTTLELNNKGFDVLRKTNGTFEKIGFVQSKAIDGYSTTTIEYTFEDKYLPNDKTVYYRLVQVDLSGKQSFSEIKVITNSDYQQPILVYPNPSRGNLQIIIPAEVYGKVDVTIFSATGSIVNRISNSANKRIDFTGLQPGFYIIKVNTQLDNNSYTKRLIVQ